MGSLGQAVGEAAAPLPGEHLPHPRAPEQSRAGGHSPPPLGHGPAARQSLPGFPSHRTCCAIAWDGLRRTGTISCLYAEAIGYPDIAAPAEESGSALERESYS